MNSIMSSSMDKKDPLQEHRKPSLRQEYGLVNFIQKHPLLVQSKQVKILNRVKVYKLWIEMAKELNSIEGVEKSPTGWLRYWIDKKRYISVKHRRIESGVPNLKLSPLEKNILNLSLQEKKNHIMQIKHELTDDCEVTQHKEDDNGENYEEKSSSECNGTKQYDSLESDENDMRMIEVMDVPEQYVTIMDGKNIQWEGTAAAVVGDTVIAENLTPSVEYTPDVTMGVIKDVYTLHGVEMASPPEAVRNVAVAEEMPVIGQNDGVSARRIIWFDSPSRRRGSSTAAAAQRPSAAAQHRRRTALSSPRAGARPVRRRPLQRSPPSQRTSEMASLTERFIAIEERRAEAELAWARAMEANAQGQKRIAEALDRFSNAMCQCVEKVLHNRAQNTST